MIKINEHKIDIVLQVEEFTSIQKIFDQLTLEVDNVLIICPELFLQRFIQSEFENIDSYVLDNIEKKLKESNGFISLDFSYKKKLFDFHFIILSSEKKIINHPFKGNETYNIAFKQIKID